MSKPSTPKAAIDLAKQQGAKMVDIKFVDTFGTWQHFSVPTGELNEDVFTDGFGFDGSSIRGWKSIEASDMLAMPDPATAFIDPFCAVPTLSLTCTIAETGTKEAYNRDPRGIAQKAEKFLQGTGLADSAVFGPEAEFFVFDNVQFDQKVTARSTPSTARKLPGTRAARRCPTWVTRSVTRKATSQSARRTRNRTSAVRCAL
jgi:glutamine synthetase